MGLSPPTATDQSKSICAIDGVSIQSLVDQFGSPLFVFSEQTLREKYAVAHDAFSSRYPNTKFVWSYKTNYLNAICSVFHQLGAGAEVVSAMEYDKARRMHIPGHELVLNGPHKPIALLNQAIDDGALINIDHLQEIADIESIARDRGRKIRVGIRVSMNQGEDPRWSRFGFCLESGHALEAARRVAESGLLEIHALHCHVGTQILDPALYGQTARRLVAFGYQLRDQFGFRIDTLDLGGGFPSACRRKDSVNKPIPPIDDFAHAICDALMDCLDPGDRPKLVLESGRALVDEAGFLIASVIAAKETSQIERAYVVDAGINLLPMSQWHQFDVYPEGNDGSGKDDWQAATIYGPLCMYIDVIRDSVKLPQLKRDQRLVIWPVGAYNLSQATQFIQYRPNVAMIAEDGTAKLIRHGEDQTDIERREQST